MFLLISFVTDEIVWSVKKVSTRPHLIQRKFIGILKDFIPIEFLF